MMSSQQDGSDMACTASVALAGCRITRPPTFAGHVEIVAARQAPRGFAARLSNNLGVCMKFGASHEVMSDGRHLVYPADAVRVRVPGCVWSSEVADVGFLSIDIDSSLLPQSLRRQPMRFLERECPDVRRFAVALETGDTRLAQESALAELIRWLFTRALLDADELCEDPPRARAIRQAQEYLAASLSGNPSLEDLATVTGTNKFVLLRYFKKEFGIGPHSYLVRLRVERARYLLARGQPPIEVATAVGFADQGHLGRHFRRIVGVTPGEYAKRSRSVTSVVERCQASQ